MTLVWALLVAAIFIVLLIISGLRTRKKIWKQQTAALVSLKQLKSLIAFVQKHRGMCAAYIQGGAQTLHTIQELQQKILAPIIHNVESAPLVTAHLRWSHFTAKWQRLSKSVSQLSLEESYSQHTEMIANLLYLLEDIAEQQRLNKNTFETLPNVSLLWRELPCTAEYIGQSRAMGVGVAATGISTQVDKVKLGYLETKIKHISTQVFKKIENHGAHTHEQSRLIKLATEACSRLTSIIESEFLQVTDVKIASDKYFTIASESMDAINSLLDYELKQVDEHLKVSA